jgi:hypothetical protein
MQPRAAHLIAAAAAAAAPARIAPSGAPGAQGPPPELLPAPPAAAAAAAAAAASLDLSVMASSSSSEGGLPASLTRILVDKFQGEVGPLALQVQVSQGRQGVYAEVLESAHRSVTSRVSSFPQARPPPSRGGSSARCDTGAGSSAARGPARAPAGRRGGEGPLRKRRESRPRPPSGGV